MLEPIALAGDASGVDVVGSTAEQQLEAARSQIRGLLVLLEDVERQLSTPIIRSLPVVREALHAIQESRVRQWPKPTRK